MTTKRDRFTKEVDRMKENYRKFPTEKLRQLDKQGAKSLKAYVAAVREVLRERENSN